MPCQRAAAGPSRGDIFNSTPWHAVVKHCHIGIDNGYGCLQAQVLAITVYEYARKEADLEKLIVRFDVTCIYSDSCIRARHRCLDAFPILLWRVVHNHIACEMINFLNFLFYLQDPIRRPYDRRGGIS